MVSRAGMFLQRAFKINVLETMGVVSLLVLPVSGVCQSALVQVEESSESIEEVVVLGSNPLFKLRLEMYRAEDALYNLYNSLNTNDEFDMSCYKEASIGSQIRRRVCRTNFDRKRHAEEAQKIMEGEIDVIDPVLEIKRVRKRMLADMAEKALEHPELLKAIKRYSETRRTLKSESERKCEGSRFCWKQ
jgi:hypothetical protein